MIWLAILLAVTPPTTAARVDAVANGAKLAGEVLVARGDEVLVDKGYGTIAPAGGARHRAGTRWRLASITKQVTAALLVKAMPDGLDRPLGAAMERPSLGTVTLRQLLTHHSGLPNPDDTAPGTGGVPGFYQRDSPDIAYCTSRPAVPGSDFGYNNCDYLVAGEALIGDMDGIDGLWPAGMRMARRGESGVPGFVRGRPEPHYELATFFTAGGLIGTARAVYRFDRSLMTGAFLPAPALAELWRPEGGRSYQALGQWVFPGRLNGCAAPKRIVQRDGEIGGVQTRNYILPDDDLVVVVFTNRGSEDFDIGEIWQGKGFAYDLLSAVACP